MMTRARREGVRWVGALTMCSLVKPNSIQYDRTEVLDDIPVDRQVCECTGGENDTNIPGDMSNAWYD